MGKFLPPKWFARTLILVVLGLEMPAFGDVGSAERETARQLMDDGDRKSAEKDYTGALEVFLKAHAIMHVPTTGIEVARTYLALGRLVEARDATLEIVRMPTAAADPAVFVRARADAMAMAAELAERIPTLLVTVIKPDVGARVRVDGVLLVDAVRVVPRAVDPGRHQIDVEADGFRRSTREVEIVERDRSTIEISLEREGERPVKIAVVPARQIHPAVYVSYGIAGVGIASGIATGILSIAKTSEAKDRCLGSVCPPDTENMRGQATAFAWMSNVSFAVGLVGVGIGTYFLLANPTAAPKKTSSLNPVFTTTGRDSYVGFHGSFE